MESVAPQMRLKWKADAPEVPQPHSAAALQFPQAELISRGQSRGSGELPSGTTPRGAKGSAVISIRIRRNQTADRKKGRLKTSLPLRSEPCCLQ